MSHTITGHTHRHTQRHVPTHTHTHTHTPTHTPTHTHTLSLADLHDVASHTLCVHPLHSADKQVHHLSTDEGVGGEALLLWQELTSRASRATHTHTHTHD